MSSISRILRREQWLKPKSASDGKPGKWIAVCDDLPNGPAVQFTPDFTLEELELARTMIGESDG